MPIAACVAMLASGATAHGQGAGSPIGNVEHVSAHYGVLSVKGWALDPNVPSEPVSVHVYVGGQGHNTGPARITRPDVAAAFAGAGPDHGIALTIPGIAPGTHRVDVYAINKAGAGDNVLLKSVDVAFAGLPAGTPFGHFERTEGLAGGRARVVGWTIDPDDQSVPVDVHVYVNGPAGSSARGVNLGAATALRPDVANVYPQAGDRHGLDAVVDGLAPGNHALWVYAIDAAGGGANPLLGARLVTVPVATPAPAPQPVVPAKPAVVGAFTVAGVFRDGRLRRLRLRDVARGSRVAVRCVSGCRKRGRVGATRQRRKAGRPVGVALGAGVGPGSRIVVRVAAKGRRARARSFKVRVGDIVPLGMRCYEGHRRASC